LFIPLKINNTGYLLNVQRYNNHVSEGYGLGLGVSRLRLTGNIYTDLRLNIWNQPDSFFGDSKKKGGSIGVRTNFPISDHSSAFIFIGGKTRGWLMGNPYLDESLSVRTGFSFKMLKSEK
jgi:hypothetical protein